PQEDRLGGPAVVVVSDAFWRERLNGDPTVVGGSRTLGGVSRTIVGVMPASFRYPSTTTEAWIPAQMSAGLMQARQARFYTAVGRLKPGVTPEQAEADLSTVQAQLGEQFPQTDKGWTARAIPLKEEKIGGVRRSLWRLFGAGATGDAARDLDASGAIRPRAGGRPAAVAALPRRRAGDARDSASGRRGPARPELRTTSAGLARVRSASCPDVPHQRSVERAA